MCQRYVTFLCLFMGFFACSCSRIEVSRGPFDIEFDPTLISDKLASLNQIDPVQARDSLPNIVLILVDDLGKNDIAIYDESGIQTPNLSRIAERGVVFSAAYSTSAVCSPSRAGMMTGRYQQRFGFERQPMNRYPVNRLEYYIVEKFVNTDPMRLINPMASPSREQKKRQGIPPGEILLPEVLQKRGYATGIFGKWHLGSNSPFLPNERGFNTQYGFYEAFTHYAFRRDPGIINYRHDYFANKHIWRQKRKKSCAIRVNDSIVKEREYLTFSIAREANSFIEQNKEGPFFLYAAFNAPHTPFQVPVDYYNRFVSVANDNKRVYYGMIAALDDAIGMILDKLEQEDLLENTLILFASDNGGATYTGATDNGSLNAGKMTQFEGGINVPCIISWAKKIPVDTIFNRPVSLMDFFSTALSAGGIKLSSGRVIDGVNLLPYLTGLKNESPHPSLFWRTDFNKCVKYKKWKLIWNVRDEMVYLFDLEKDKEEKNNLAGNYPDLVAQLQETIIRWESELKPPAWPGVMEIEFKINGDITWWAI